MPMVCEWIDGSANFEEAFVDSHGSHSINCMALCGPDMQFYFSYANCASSHQMENGWRPAQLGDSPYPLKE